MKTKLTTFRFTKEDQEIKVEATSYIQALDILIWKIGGDAKADEWTYRG